MIAHLRRYAIRFILISTVFGLCFLIPLDRVCADESSVTIEAPATATRGEEITIKVTALHDANNFFHYTDWLYIMVNDKEVARWDYTWRKRPEGKRFTKEITYTVTDPLEIQAEAHCNLHGSTGPKTLKVSVNNL
jgi:desulfoferrodoxin (superoxide reductase-like protein)